MVTFASRTDIDQLYKQLSSYVQREEHTDLKNEIKDCATKSQLSGLEGEFEKLKKDQSRFIRSDEVMTRFQVMQEHFKDMVEQRVHVKQLKQLTKSIDQLKESVNDQFDKICTNQNEFDNELSSFSKDMKRMTAEMAKQLTVKDGQRIWRTFQRFAEYHDLKDLYQKCMPEISKFECRIMDFQASIDKFNEIIIRLDENISQKVDKSSMRLFETNFQQNYVSKAHLDQFENEQNVQSKK